MSEQSTKPVVIEDAAQPIPVKLFLWTDDHDTVVASDLDDAAEVWKQNHGSSYEDVCDDKFEECWYRVDPDKVIKIHDDDGGATVTKTASEWAESNGRGFLCSTDW